MCACPCSSKAFCQGYKLAKLPKQDNHCDCGLFLLWSVRTGGGVGRRAGVLGGAGACSTANAVCLQVP